MADTFSRDSLTSYEAQPAKVVPDTTPPVEAKNVTPAAKEPAEPVAATPSGDDAESAIQSETGDGTSDVTAESSTASVEPSDDTDPSEETGEPAAVEAAATPPPPKKGSAAARVQEVLDKAEGYKEFGKQMAAELQKARNEIAQLKAGGSPASARTASAPQNEDPPMPDLSDPDVDFDTDKLRAKTAKWIKDVAKAAATPDPRVTEQAQTIAHVNAKTKEFAATHDDWKEVVEENPILIANQLSRDASLAVAKSDNVAALMYEMGKDPLLAVKISKMSPAQQLVAIGKLEAKIEAQSPSTASKTNAAGAKPATTKSLTNAPPPPSPTRASGRAQERDETDPSMDMEEFARRHRMVKQDKRAQHRKAMGLS